MTDALDHLVYAVPDLDAGIRAVETLMGLAPTPGGRHPDWGTANALVRLGAGSYLEIIGPDPAGASPAGVRPFGIDVLEAPRLVTWAVRIDDIGTRVASARRAGHDPGAIVDMSRTRPDGVRLTWRLTMSTEPTLPGDGLVPFLIDWGGSRHPADSLPSGGMLLELSAEHPRPQDIAPRLRALECTLPVTHGARPLLRARIACGGRTVLLT